MKPGFLNIIAKIKSYLVTQPIDKAWIFGSFSRGEESRDSDVDILVEFSPGSKIGLLYFKIIDDLENICARKVDLTELSMLDSRVKPSVLADKILIYERVNA